MSTAQLIVKIKQTSNKMTDSQIKQRLVSAHIINANGEYDPRYFRAETVQASKRIIANIKS